MLSFEQGLHNEESKVRRASTPKIIEQLRQQKYYIQHGRLKIATDILAYEETKNNNSWKHTVVTKMWT